jgi:hypothetical protein
MDMDIAFVRTATPSGCRVGKKQHARIHDAEQRQIGKHEDGIREEGMQMRF